MDELTEFLREIERRWPVGRGSLVEVAKPCIRAGCAACRRGEKHPAFNFTFRKGGTQRCLYVARELVPVLRQALENGRRVEERMVEIAEALILAHRQRRKATPARAKRPKRRR